MADRLCMGCMEVYEDKYDICPYCGYKEGTPAKEAIHLAPGTVIGNKYIVGQSIGNGGFGVTYIGWDAVLNQSHGCFQRNNIYRTKRGTIFKWCK